MSLNNHNHIKKILFAGGCFWGIQHYFSLVKGVIKTSVGYAQGTKKHPTYKEVCQGETGHAEVCKVVYDKNHTKLKYLLEHFIQIVDTSTINKQANDIGTQYRSGIYYYDELDKREILEFFDLKKPNLLKPFVTEILPAGEFYLAEEYHQDYLDKNPSGYCHINPSKYKNIENIDNILRSRSKL